MNKPISEVLKESRLKAGIELEKVSQDTFIPLKFLQDMENGKWQNFPSKAHRIGFLKKYLSYLKIPDEILLEYPEFNLNNKEKEAEPEKKEFSFVPLILWTAVIVVIIIFVVFFIQIFLKKEKNIVNTGSGYVIPVKESQTCTITIKAIENVWLRVIVDGEKRIEKLFKSGESVTINGSTIKIRTGNAGGILIEKDGKTSGPFGKTGQVKEIMITRESIL